MRLENQQKESEGELYSPQHHTSSDTLPNNHGYNKSNLHVLFANVDEIDLYLEYLENSGERESYYGDKENYQRRRVVERRSSARNRVVRFRTLR